MGERSATSVPQLLVPKFENKYTHQLFRYPAKFHPPVVGALLERFTSIGDVVLDPFVGSGTALVECAVSGRRSVGVDIDPLAIQVALAKTREYDLDDVAAAIADLHKGLNGIERPAAEYERRMFADISTEEFDNLISGENLWIPEIPRLDHWFRRYVTIDLARIKRLISEIDAMPSTRILIDIAFASIIRNSSNADPVPVSGLEYTSHMKARDEKGRLVNPFALLRTALKRMLPAVQQYRSAVAESPLQPTLVHGNATRIDSLGLDKVDAVITSPPYHNAVDYYRRHQLEMFWLGLTVSQEERLQLLPGYIGRPRIAAKDPLLGMPWNPGPLADEWERSIREVNLQRALDFRHYVTAMTMAFSGLSRLLASGSPAVFVVGHSVWNGKEIPTRDLFAEMCSSSFVLDQQLWYPIVNRYMSYARRNSASIDREYVLVFRRL
ncbi:DNA methyltransferase [Herbidospora daliensis]|uniref:DNA methyltransferase n=1 Tax=Herbidospora daliensis TaxID=295585 RepID=UPI000A063D9D|nr:DNA methyltransferase [Herbidospora daliensis]